MALAPELASLVHHVELHKAGWWDKSIQRIILTAFLHFGKAMTVRELAETLSREFQVRLDTRKVESQLNNLRHAGEVIQTPDEKFKLGEAAREKYREDLRRGEELEAAVKAAFNGYVEKHSPALAGEKTWTRFNQDFLQPLVKEAGANTYKLLEGNTLHTDSDRLQKFVKNFHEESRQGFMAAVDDFFHPDNAQVRSYVLRLLNAYFFIEATSLKEVTIRNLTKTAGTSPIFDLFLDTNFLIPLLGLDDSTEEAVTALSDLVRQLSGKVTINLYALPITMDEFHRLISAKAQYLQNVRLPTSLARVAAEAGLDGIDLKFVEEYRRRGGQSAKSYFEPYLNDLLLTMRSKGVEPHDDSSKEYTTKQTVIDDILVEKEREKELFKEKAKSYEKLKHDMVLWHYVRDRRPRWLESPLMAKSWMVTLDSKMFKFDKRKKRLLNNRVVVCLHPATLVQMLQFWVPRTQQFEEAVLTSLRLPFLSQEFDSDAERVTIEILKTLGEIENVDDLGRQTMSAILMNRVLRQKISQGQTKEEKLKLVREAMVEELQLAQANLREKSEENLQLRSATEAAGGENRRLEDELSTTRQELQTAQGQLLGLASEKETMEGRLAQLERAAEEREKAENKQAAVRRFWLLYGAAPLPLIAALGALAGWQIGMRTRFGFLPAASLAWTLLLFAQLWLADHMGGGNEHVKDTRGFRIFDRSWKFLFAIVGLLWNLAVNVVSNGLYDNLKQ